MRLYDFALHPNVLQVLGDTESDDDYFSLSLVDFVTESLPSNVACRIGVVMSGRYALCEVVLHKCNRTTHGPPDDSLDPDKLQDITFVASDKMPSILKPQHAYELALSEKMETCFGSGANGFLFMKSSDIQTFRQRPRYTNKMIQDLARNKGGGKRKRVNVVENVQFGDMGILRRTAVTDAACAWFEKHGKNFCIDPVTQTPVDLVKVEMESQRGAAASSSRQYIRTYKVFDMNKGREVVRRTLSECIETVEAFTGRNFRDDMRDNAQDYNITITPEHLVKAEDVTVSIGP